MTLQKQVLDRLRAGALVVVVQEADEVLAVEACRMAAKALPPGRVEVLSPIASDFDEKFAQHRDSNGGTLIIPDFLRVRGSSAQYIRLIREFALQSKEPPYPRLILVETPGTTVPESLSGDIEYILPELPGVDELKEELDQFVQVQKEAAEKSKNKDQLETIQAFLDGNGEMRHAVACSMAGLARHEAARLLNRCWVDIKRLDPEWLRKAKAGRVSDRLGGALSFIDPHGADIGGLESLKKWVEIGKKTFASEKALNYGLPELKGLLFVGVPGCGKSAMVRAIARDYGMPLMRLDAGKLFGSLVGESEMKTRQAIQAAEACAPCILWIDEIEKALGGKGEGPQGDSGVSTRMVGSLLTWLQDKTKPVFVVATANSVAALRPELLRKGRIDEIFFVDLPDCEEREAIAKIHLEMDKRKHSIEGVDPKEMAALTDGFSGAEIEQAVIDSMRLAFSMDRKTGPEDVKTVISETTPLSKTLADDIDRVRKWARGRARPAGKKMRETPPPEAGASPFMKRPSIQG